MSKKQTRFTIYLMFLAFILASIACGSMQVRILTPTVEAEEQIVNENQEPVSEPAVTVDVGDQSVTDSANTEPTPVADYAHLWTEYRDPRYGYGVGLPAHWIVYPTPIEGTDGAMTTTSYDETYFMAHSTKGWWTAGESPEGAIKIDFVGFSGEDPNLDLATAIRDLLSRDEQSVVLSTHPAVFNGHEAVLVTTARPDALDETYTSVTFRLNSGAILLVTAYWGDALNTPDVQAILNSMAFEDEPVFLPAFAPQPPLTDPAIGPRIDDNTLQVVAWLGHIVGFLDGSQYDDFVLLSPPGAGEFGIRGSTPEIESLIHFLRDAEGSDANIHLWGVFSCGVDDYNNCQLVVDRIHREGIIEDSVEGWTGSITAKVFNESVSHVFQLAGEVPMWYSLHASQDPTVQAQIEDLRDTGAIVQVWGTLTVGVPDVNGVRIEPTRLEVLEPGNVEQASLIGSDITPGWQVYTNDRFGYSLQYPGKAEIVEHGPDGGIPTDEIPPGMSADLYQEQLQKIYPKLCVQIMFEQGYLNISAPPNAGARYTPCGITGLGSGEVIDKTEEVSVGGKIYTAEGLEYIGSGNLDDHMEMFIIELEDGTWIRYGGGSTSNASYEDYLMNTKGILLQILATYEDLP